MMRLLHALVAALLAMPLWAAPPAPRVFFAPQDRAAITAMRRAGPAPSATVAVVDSSHVVPVELKLEGISLARSGGHFAWIGGKRYADGAQFGAYRLRVSRTGVALLSAGTVVRQIRVGESAAAP